MNYDPANSFGNFQAFANLPGADRFQTLFADAGSRGQEAIEKGRKTAEELAELTRANVEAMVEASKIAATGAKTVGEDALQRTREGIEQNVADLKCLAQATSPTEFFQLQSEMAKQNFDRVVASFSQLTEASVKLAGEAIQPLSNRAALNAEKLNELTA
jgi:phasin family protein